MSQFGQLEDSEWQWIQSSVEGAKLLVSQYSPNDGGQPITAAVLYRTWAAWLATLGPSGTNDGNQINTVINTIGLTFGQLIVDNHGFQWAVSPGENGYDMAVLALPGRGDVVSYPLHVVAGRWPNRETFFLEAVELMLTTAKRDAEARYEKMAQEAAARRVWPGQSSFTI